MKYRPELDGLRAIAVLSVLLFHVGLNLFSGGFVGVDIFFVISGYLITFLSLDNTNKQRFSVFSFYERRARRIFPALFFVVLMSMPFAWLWIQPQYTESFWKSLIPTVLFYSNVFFRKATTDYFSPSSDLMPHIHTWSLGIEFQFYILFPLFVTKIKKIGKKNAFVLLASLFFMSLLSAHWGLYNLPKHTFFLLPFRIWELLLGSLCALYLSTREHPPKTKYNAILSLLGLLMISYAIFTFSNTTPNPGFFTLIPTVGTALLILFATKDTACNKWLSYSFFTRIGLISYSVYLWHQPLFAFARHRMLDTPTQSTMLGLSLLSLILGWLTYRCIEKPFRDNTFISKKMFMALSISAMILIITIGLIYKHAPHKLIRPIKNPAGPTIFSDRLEREHTCSIFYKIETNSDTSKDLENVMKKCYIKGRTFFLIGDSHAHFLDMELRKKLAQYGKNLITISKASCLMIPGTKLATPSSNTDCIQLTNKTWSLFNNNEAPIIIAHRWRPRFAGQPFDNQEGGKDNRFDTTQRYTIIGEKSTTLEKHLTKKIEEKSKNNKIIIISQIPETGWNVISQINKLRFLDHNHHITISTRYDIYLKANKIVLKWLSTLEKKANISVLHVENIVCKKTSNRCINVLDGKSLYRDSHHPTPLFSKLIAQMFANQILTSDSHI